jgi:UDP-glucose/GDP-mannose dehydrogenase family, central domain
MSINSKTLVVGLGEVGGALAEVLERKHPVLKHDLEPREFSDPIGVLHICIPFISRAQFEPLAIDYIRRFKPELTIINSTVLPGTTRSIAAQTGAAVAYSPVRGKHVKMAKDLLHYVKFVAAGEEAWADQAEAHFQQHGMKTRKLEKPETLEVAKLGETTYFGVIIAWAQELNRYVQRVGGDYEEATEFFEEVAFLPRQRYFPGFIGGHCVIPNINLLLQMDSAALLEAVLDSNERRAAELKEEAAQNGSEAHPQPDCEPKVLAHR